MFARDDQNVNRRLRVNVGEGITKLVLIDGSGRYASIQNLAEEAAHNAFSVQERVSASENSTTETRLVELLASIPACKNEFAKRPTSRHALMKHFAKVDIGLSGRGSR